MKTYAYRGYDAGGKAARGLIEAGNPKEAREKLAGRGVFAESISAAMGASKGRWGLAWRGSGVTVESRAEMYRELGSLIEAGLPLSQALDIMIEAQGQPARSLVLAGVRDAVREGSGLADGFDRGVGGLHPVERTMLQTGERSGSLPRSLHALAESLEEQQRVRRHVSAALAYPAFLVGLATLIALAVFGVLLPRFGDLFADAGMELPLLTRIFLGMSGVVPWMVLLVALAIPAGGWMMLRRWRGDSALRAGVERWVMTRSIVAGAASSVYAYRFADTFALLLSSGTQALEAMTHAGAATGSAWLDQEARDAATSVRQGASIGEALSHIPPFQRHLAAWIRAGEAGGNLADMLARAARRCQEDARRRIDRMLAWIEPALIVMVGVFVLLVALAILLPILSLNRSIG